MQINNLIEVKRYHFDNDTIMNFVTDFEAIYSQHRTNKNQYSFTPDEAAKMLNMTVENLHEMVVFENIIINKIALKNGDEVPGYLKSQLCKIYVNQQLRKCYM